MADLAPELVSAIADRYRIVRELGRGGMASVYLADDLKHGRRVAIKVMDPAIGSAIGSGRFLREIEIAARLTHPHILPLFDSGATGEHLYYVMPYIAGESLRDRLDREGRLPLEEAIRLTREIAGALAHAHQQGLVHRDIKPENVLLAEGIVLVADFGIARTLQAISEQEPAPGAPPTGPAQSTDGGTFPGVAGPIDAVHRDATLVIGGGTGDATQVIGDASGAATEAVSGGSEVTTRAGVVVGTPQYMAPEQAVGSATLDGRADQYALGCVLYELLTGRPPFQARSLGELILLHTHADPRPCTALRVDVPEEVDRVLARSLAKNPADRFADVARFADALASAWDTASGALPVDRPALDVPNNLPKDRTRFIGRIREINECVRLLGGTRLLTVMGIGGGGKTRFSIELARRVGDRYPDGVWFVELANLSDPERLVSSAAAALSVQEAPDRPLLSTLEEHLRPRRALLLLNNCEHLREAAAELATSLLRAAPEVVILGTSRTALGVADEQVYALGTLALPAKGAADPAAVARSEAARLFLDRATFGDPTFELTAETAPAVAEICSRLDGIPLAIELAAARVRLLSVIEIRNRLEDRFRLLVGGGKTALPQHRTLLAAIQWSYDQLDADEQRLFRLLGIFRGGWTLAAATRTAGDDADEFVVLDLLGRLLDDSLLVSERVESGATRYTMLETVREYACAQLDAAGGTADAANRHLDYLLALAREALPKFTGPEAGAVTRDMNREVENVVAAQSRCHALPGGTLRALTMIWALRLYWIRSGALSLGRRLTEDTLGLPDAQAPTMERARGLQTVASIAYFQKRFEDARLAMEEALAIARTHNNVGGIASGLSMLGSLAQQAGDLPKARSCFNEAVELFRQNQRTDMVGAMLNSLAVLAHAEGDDAEAERLHRESIELAEREGDLASVGMNLLNLCSLALGRGDREAALGHLRVGAERTVAAGSRYLVPVILDLAGVLLVGSGDHARAARFFGAAEGMRTRMQSEQELESDALTSAVRQAREEMGEERFAAYSGAGRLLDDAEAWDEARRWLGSHREME